MRTRAAALGAGLLPGLGLVLLVALPARVIGAVTPDVLSEITIAVVVGVVTANLVALPDSFMAGIRFAVRVLLRVGIVFLGAALSFGAVVSTGLGALVVIVLSMLLALGLTIVLGRLLGVPPRLALLVAVGTAICGNSAIVATAPVIEARDRDVSFAIGTITLFGLSAVLLYPAFGHLMGLSDEVFGTWAGVAVNDTSQVTAAGFAYSEAAGATATIVKLTRNALMGPVILVIGAWYASWSRSGGSADRSGSGEGGRQRRARLSEMVPLFVIGFLALAVANSAGLIPPVAATAFEDLARFLILLALAGVGLSTNLREMRAVGLRPLYLGLGVAAVLAVFSLALITAL
ncbi:MAG TPA: putative sulfate exporter family transporter [Candidatus Limnocylindria bacterium]|nr:putative sulfate exporter family transporter [Candidatus Limnocylindria bacterium]